METPVPCYELIQFQYFYGPSGYGYRPSFSYEAGPSAPPLSVALPARRTFPKVQSLAIVSSSKLACMDSAYSLVEDAQQGPTGREVERPNQEWKR
jgi:hypothetical protein